MKDKILELRNQGKSYRQIEKELKCSKSLIAYHVNNTTKNKAIDFQNTNRFTKRQALKESFGGKCEICGYNKCLDALQFHHLDPLTKKFEISEAIWKRVKVSDEEILEEAKKCKLVCANCHAELHHNINNNFKSRKSGLVDHPSLIS